MTKFTDKPVAYSFELARSRKDGEYTDWDTEPRYAAELPQVPEGSIRNIKPLYTTTG